MKTLKPKYHTEFKEINKRHFYDVDGKLCPSVTSILKIIGGEKTDMLINWAKKVSLEHVQTELQPFLDKKVTIDTEFLNRLIKAGKKRPEFELEKAANIGTACHDAIDKYILTGEKPTNPEVQQVFNNFLKWMDEHGLKIIAGDTTVGSKLYEFGGRLDALALDKEGNVVVLDWKTSNHIVPDYFFQVAAYTYAFAEMYDLEIPKKAYIVRFSKDTPEFEVAEVDNIENLFRGFISAMILKQEVDKVNQHLKS